MIEVLHENEGMGLCSYFQLSVGGLSQEDRASLFSAAQQQDKGQRAQTRPHEALSEHKEKLLYFEGDRALKQTVQRRWGLSLSGEIPNPPVILCNLI